MLNKNVTETRQVSYEAKTTTTTTQFIIKFTMTIWRIRIPAFKNA